MFIDTHCHLDAEHFENDLESVVNNAKNSGVNKIITLGDDVPSSIKNIEIAEKYDGVYCTVGIHPELCKDTTDSDIEEIRKLATSSSKVVAIGEIGLDLHYSEVPIEKQLDVLSKQMDIAEKMNIPWVIHCRDAESYLLNLIDERNYTCSKKKGVIHCFNGAQGALDKYIECGFYISLGCYIGYPSSRKLLDVFKNIPLDKVMLETDAPYLPPQKKRGERNEPAYCIEAAKVIAEWHGLDLAEVEEITTNNAMRCFGLL